MRTKFVNVKHHSTFVRKPYKKTFRWAEDRQYNRLDSTQKDFLVASFVCLSMTQKPNTSNRLNLNLLLFEDKKIANRCNIKYSQEIVHQEFNLKVIQYNSLSSRLFKAHSEISNSNFCKHH